MHAEDEQEQLGVITDKDVKFQSHTKLIIKAANEKLSVFVKVAPFMTDFNKNVIFNFFIKGQVNYCPLFWMFSTRAVNHKINSLYFLVLEINKLYF